MYIKRSVSWDGVNTSSDVSPADLASTGAISTTPRELKIAHAREKILSAMKVNELSIENCMCTREDFECDEGK